MVYEVKCSQCGKVIDFGGHEPSEFSGQDKLPEDAFEFNDEIYCRECVREFTEFGMEEVVDRVDYLEDRLNDVLEAMGMTK
jgi:hypothetical protein